MTQNVTEPARFQADKVLPKIRKGLFWAGIVMCALGIVGITLPYFTSLFVEALIGWILAASGAIAVIGAFSLRNTSVFLWELLVGLLSFAAGVLLLVYPLKGLVVLTSLIAAVLLATGAVQFAIAFWLRPAFGWGWSAFSAVISIGLGVMILAMLPESSTAILGLVIGIDFLSTGIALLVITRSIPSNVSL